MFGFGNLGRLNRNWGAALWIVLGAVSGTAFGQSSLRLTGTVKDPAHGPVQGATVLLISMERALQTQLRGDGSFEFDDVPAGEYEMQVSARGFVKETRRIDVQKDTAMTQVAIVLKLGAMPDRCGVDFTLKYQFPNSEGPHLAGRVRELYSEKPIKNAKVVAEFMGYFSAKYQAKSDESGRYAFSKLPAGRYTVRISARGYDVIAVKDFLLPRENGAFIDTGVLKSGEMVACQ